MDRMKPLFRDGVALVSCTIAAGPAGPGPIR
jgi:hypothetical protein